MQTPCFTEGTWAYVALVCAGVLEAARVGGGVHPGSDGVSPLLRSAGGGGGAGDLWPSLSAAGALCRFPPPQVMIREKNPEGFLSAAEIPLFKLYLVMSACFLAAGVFWVCILCRNT